MYETGRVNKKEPERWTGKSGRRRHTSWRGRTFQNQVVVKDPAATAQKNQVKADVAAA